MPKEVVATRIEPGFKRKIEAEATKKEREPAWLVRRLLELGWDVYTSKNGRRAA